MIGRIRYKVAGYQCVSEWPSVISHISRYEPREAPGTATATLIRFSWAAILSISCALQHGVLEKLRPLLGFVERSDGSVCRIFTLLSGRARAVDPRPKGDDPPVRQ